MFKKLSVNRLACLKFPKYFGQFSRLAVFIEFQDIRKDSNMQKILDILNESLVHIKTGNIYVVSSLLNVMQHICNKQMACFLSEPSLSNLYDFVDSVDNLNSLFLKIKQKHLHKVNLDGLKKIGGGTVLSQCLKDKLEKSITQLFRNVIDDFNKLHKPRLDEDIDLTSFNKYLNESELADAIILFNQCIQLGLIKLTEVNTARRDQFIIVCNFILTKIDEYDSISVENVHSFCEDSSSEDDSRGRYDSDAEGVNLSRLKSIYLNLIVYLNEDLSQLEG